MGRTLLPAALHNHLRQVAQAVESSAEANLRLLGSGLVALLVAAAFQTAPARAVVYVVPTDESMVDRSPVIVFGEILSAGPGPDGSGPTTDYLFAIEELLKGFVAGSAILVRQPGGVGSGGTAMRVMGLPMLAEGDRVLLFLRQEESGAHPIVEYALGMFWEVDMGGGRSMLLREPSLQAWTTLPGSASNVAGRARDPLTRHATRFRRWISDRAVGIERAVDYVEKGLPDGPIAVQSPYRLIRTPSNCLHDLLPLRWQDFDLGNSLRMTLHSGGQVGVPGGGTAEVRAAMRAWNGDAKSHVSLATAGTATPTEQNTQSGSGQYWILYEDPFDSIHGSFDAETGGTLAITTTYYFCGGQVPVHSTLGDPPVQALQISYTQLITQDGYGNQWAALNDNPRKAHEEIMAHELGHVLGIGHSCGFGVYPCPDGGAIPEAVMRAYPHADGRGARLNSDDLAALRYLYPVSSGTGGDPDALVCSGVTCLLQGERFRVKAWYSKDGNPSQGAGAIAAALADSTGLFSADSDSPELLVRIVNQCRATGYWEVYAGVASDADFSVAVRHVETNELKWFRTRDGQSIADTEAFACTRSDDRASPAEPGGDTDGAACSGVTCILQEDRFRLKSWYTGDGGSSEVAQAIAADLGESAGLFAFDSGNPELLVRIVNRCSTSGYWAVYAGTASDADFSVAIRDTETNELKWFRSRDGQAVADTEAFACTENDGGSPPDGDPDASVCSGDTCLLQGERFRVKARYSKDGNPSQGAGAIAATLADSTGLFSADSDSPELLVRIVNQCRATGYWEVYAGVASDADFSVAVRHVETNEFKWLRTRGGQSIADTEAFACTRSDDRASPAEPGGDTDGAACSGVTCILQEDRFRLKSWYTGDGGSSEVAQAIAADLGESAGLFTFDSGNPELLVRIVNRCSTSGYWAVYAGTASDADFSVAIRDTETNELKWFRSRDGQAVANAEPFLCSAGDTSEPDLVVSSASVSDSSIDTGATFTLSATVRNQGDGRSSSTTLYYYRASNSTFTTENTQVGTDAVGALAASGTSAESIALTAPSTPGTYYYRACVEAVSGESNTDNNCSSGVRVTVSSGEVVTEYKYDDGTFENIGWLTTSSGPVFEQEFAERFRLARSGNASYVVLCVGRVQDRGASSQLPFTLNFYRDSGGAPGTRIGVVSGRVTIATPGTSGCARLDLTSGSSLQLGSGYAWVGLAWRNSTGMALGLDRDGPGGGRPRVRARVTSGSQWISWQEHPDGAAVRTFGIRLGVDHGGSTARFRQ